MLIVLDTNTLIRFFTNDIPHKADKVELLVKNEPDIFIPDVVFPELEYILVKQYKRTKNDVIAVFRFLLAQNNITISHEVKKAIPIFESSKLDMADCIIAAHSRKGKLASFDKELLSIGEVNSFWK